MLPNDTIRFLHPAFLLLLLLLPLVGRWYWLQRRRHYATLRVSSIESVRTTRTLKSRAMAAMPIVRGLAFTLLVVALARPQRTLKIENVTAEGIDIMLVMDLSSSMLARDFEPNRLEVSKRVAADFVSKRPYDRIGMVVFAGEAYTQCPLTTDQRIVNEFLANLECGLLEDGTAIGMGLATAVNRLKNEKTKSKIAILLTDGVNNSGYQSPDLAARLAREFEIKVYTIGVGTTGEALTPVSRRSDGEYIYGVARVEIDEELMRNIAQLTGGRYYRATSAEDLEKIYDEINKLEKTEIDVTAYKRYSEAFFPFAWWGLILLGLELLLRYGWLRGIP